MTAAPFNFLHIKQNTHSPWMALAENNPPALKGASGRSLTCCFFSLLLVHFSVLSVSLPCVSLSLSQLCMSSPSFPSQSVCRTQSLAGSLFPSPLPLADFFFPLGSSLQRGEKHTCQIQVGNHTISHPHQLLCMKCFDADSFSFFFLFSAAPCSAV